MAEVFDCESIQGLAPGQLRGWHCCSGCHDGANVRDCPRLLGEPHLVQVDALEGDDYALVCCHNARWLVNIGWGRTTEQISARRFPFTPEQRSAIKAAVVDEGLTLESVWDRAVSGTLTADLRPFDPSACWGYAMSRVRGVQAMRYAL